LKLEIFLKTSNVRTSATLIFPACEKIYIWAVRVFRGASACKNEDLDFSAYKKFTPRL
jgi:hypothetical protein